MARRTRKEVGSQTARRTLMVRMSDEMHTWLKCYAASHQTTMSAVVTKLLTRVQGQHKIKLPLE